MRESSTYQKILREGRTEGRVEGRTEGRVEGHIEALKQMIKRQGHIRFGASEPAHEAAIDRVADLETLESLTERVLFAKDWDELLADIPGDSKILAEP